MQKRPAPPKIEPWTPTPDEQRDFESGDKTQEWLYSLPKGALDEYRRKWIAAIDCRIAYSAATEQELMSQIKDHELQRAIIRHIPVPSAIRVVHIYHTKYTR